MDRENPTVTTSFFIMDDSSAEETEPLTPLRIQFLDEFIYDVLMASSDVDQKFLGKFAQQTERIDPYLSEQLYKILGLSVLLSKKLFRARRLRRLDITRDTKSLQLYHHIIWLSREGLVILEVAVLPTIMSNRVRLPNLAEMRVLAQKLQGSFYHIFVLFHNQPSINRAAAIPGSQSSSSKRNPTRSDSIRKTILADDEDPYEQTAGRSQQLPPGLAPITIPKPTASFLLPAQDYIPSASNAFDRSMKLARQLLGGSHPLRLSVAVEYCAYLYDCLHDGESSRGLAKITIKNVYGAEEGMDDETFDDSANLVSVLGKMMKRGLGSSTGTASKTPSVANTGTTMSSPGRRHAQPSGHQTAATTYSRTLPSQTRSSTSQQQSRAAPSSPHTSRTDRARQESSPLQEQQQSTRSSGSLMNSWWAPPASTPASQHTPPRMPAATNVSPRSPRSQTAAQKLPKMTPWEAPSVQESPPRIRGGGGSSTVKTKVNGSGTAAAFVRRNTNDTPGNTNGHIHTNGFTNGYSLYPSSRTSDKPRTRTPEEQRAKEEKRRRVEIAEKKSRSSEGLRRRGSKNSVGSGSRRSRHGENGNNEKLKSKTKTSTRVSSGSVENLDRKAVHMNGSAEKTTTRTRRRR